MALLGVVVALVVLGVVDLVGVSADQHSRVSHAKQQANEICHGLAHAEDVQDQTHVVFSCGDGPQRSLEYGVDYWIFW